MDFHNFKMDYLKKRLPQIAKAQTGKDVSKLDFLGGGSYGRVFRATLSDGESFVLKAYRRKGLHENEAFQLNLLSSHTTVPMPKVLFLYGDEDISVLAMSYIEGINVLDLRYLLKSTKAKKQFSESVVSGMLQWHSIKGEKFGYVQNPVYNSWYEFYKKEKIEPVLDFAKAKAEKGEFSKNELQLLTKSTELYERLGDEPQEPVLIHGDLNIMNIMANPKTFELTGFIDPCGSMWANRDYDLYQLRNMWGDCYRLFETYKKNYSPSKNLDFRIAYYGAINEVCCFKDSGEDMALWRGIWNHRLKKELKKY